MTSKHLIHLFMHSFKNYCKKKKVVCFYDVLGIRSVVLKNLDIFSMILELEVGFTDEETKA